MQYSSSVVRSGIQTFARYRNVKSGFVQSVVTGGVLYADSTYYYRVFLASGTLAVATAALNADIIVIAGGGAGSQDRGGGGGAGGYVVLTNQALTTGSYAVVVGAGGAGRTTGQGLDGSSSQFASLATAIGGGGGGDGSTGANGRAGGSGGGGGNNPSIPTGAGGAGTSGQGYAGGTGTYTAPNYGAGGGGGAGGVGSNGTSTSSGNGGSGVFLPAYTYPTSTGVNGYLAGGGGGGSYGGGTNGAGGAGGGGAGVRTNASNPGVANTGGGGGSNGEGGAYAGGSGGSGIVIVRYPKSSALTSSIWQTDSSSASLKVAAPLSADLIYNDYSATIKGSGTNYTMTPVNSPVFQTSVAKYYGSAINMGVYSENKYISTPTNANLQIGTSDFTLEGWFYFTNTAVSGGYQALASHAGDSGDSQPGWVWILEANTTLAFYACTAGSSGWGIALSTSTTPTANSWHHIAVTRSSGVLRMFLNGTQVGTVTSNNNIGVPASQTFRVGSYQYFPGPVSKGMSGYIQDFRFYIGAAKYTGTFTPPTQIYVGG